VSRIEDEQRIVRDLGIVQLGKLRANKHKPDWQAESVDDLFAFLLLEVEELRAALLIGKRAHVALECADVANFAAMLADRVSAEDCIVMGCPCRGATH